MADNATAPAVEQEFMYRNKTKTTQIVFPKGQWDKRIVHPDHTVCLTEKQGNKFMRYFERVDVAATPAKGK